MTKNPAENMRHRMALRAGLILARMMTWTTLAFVGAGSAIFGFVYLTGIGMSMRTMSEEMLSTNPRMKGVPSSNVHCSVDGNSASGVAGIITGSKMVNTYCPDLDPLASTRETDDNSGKETDWLSPTWPGHSPSQA